MEFLIQEWTNLGKRYIDEKYWGAWVRAVIISVEGQNAGLEVFNSLTVIQSLNRPDTSLSDALLAFQLENGTSALSNFELNTISNTCARGEAFRAFYVDTTHRISKIKKQLSK